jgi:biotin-dependent carboxylase-like uncharacterized protein
VTALRIVRAGPLCTVQDRGRPGMLRHGISASGPMDVAAFERAAGWLGGGGSAGIEFAAGGLGFVVEGGNVGAGFDGGGFGLAVNGVRKSWPARVVLKDGDAVEVTPGAAGNYGYVRFDREIEVAPLMGSRATNVVAGLGGFQGRSLIAGDVLQLGPTLARGMGHHPRAPIATEGAIRVVWGLHADAFDGGVRQAFLAEAFQISSRLDRMGARLVDGAGVFATPPTLTLVSDAIVPGDVQILGDGTPIVLLRDHQPTGGYPRIATVISADLDRFVQLRPGAPVRFEAVTLAHVHAILMGKA